MNRTLHRVKLVGAGTDTPDFGEPDPEESLQNGSVMDPKDEETPQFFGVSKKQQRARSKKKLDTLIEILDDQISELTQIIDTQSVREKAVETLKKVDEGVFRQKKLTSVTVAAIIHAVRVLNMPVTCREILNKVECCERQMKKILLAFQKVQQPSDYKQVVSFMQSIATQMKVSEQFFETCCVVLNRMDSMIGGEQDHVIAATVFKMTWDLVMRGQSLSVAHVAQMGKCCEYSVRMMLKKIYQLPLDIQKIQK